MGRAFPQIARRIAPVDIASLRARHPEHWMRATALRALALDAVAAANSGHSGMPIGMADVATVLFERHLRFDPADPRWPDRDRFILSAGHGSMLLYALLHLTGYGDVTLDDIRAFRQWGARTAGHPEYGHAAGIETTTGPLGQGLASSVGFAMAEEHLRSVWGERLQDHRTWVIAGDGCLMEGVSHEAIGIAGRQQLSRLIVLWDDNGITIDGKVALSDVTDQRARFAASGWDVFDCDGHDPDDIARAMDAAVASPRPALIACRTHIALGHPAQDTSKGHGALTDKAGMAAAKEAWGWASEPFEIPEALRDWWRGLGARGATARAEWQARLDALPATKREEFRRIFAGEAPERLGSAVRGVKKAAAVTSARLATRSASEKVLEAVNPVMPETFGGSADLTGSNNTKTADLGIFDVGNRAGRYMHWGIREHGMAAAMNGLALHGGLRPYGGTFLVFSDYSRPAIRLSAMMKAPVVHVMTHDSIGLGEDGPTHQPVEHLAMLRATPGLVVLRPADLTEVAEAWEVALSRRAPSVLALSRQGLEPVRTRYDHHNLTARGAYVLAGAPDENPDAILIATGSEVGIAMAARELLAREGIGARVVSMPSMELFAEQDAAWRESVLPAGPVRVAIEAGVRQGWDRWLLGEGGNEARAGFVGMTGFGASAPQERLYREFGITAEAAADKVRALL